MNVEIGDTVYVTCGVLRGDLDFPVTVMKATVENATRPDDVASSDGIIVKVWDSGTHYIGRTAFVDKEEAYLAASVFQGNNVLVMTGRSVDHTSRLNKLLQKVRPNMMVDWTTANFAAWEFLCPDCKQQRMNQRFIIRLQISRGIAGIPYVIGSGWRCKKRNTAVGGVEDSSHQTGLAADIMALTSKERFIIVDALLRAGFMRIGIAKYYIHVDSDPDKPQGIMYLY